MMRAFLLTVALLWSVIASAQAPSGGPLLMQNSLSEIAARGTQSVARINLGLGSLATQSAGAAAITGGTISGLSSLGVVGNATTTGTLGVGTNETVGGTLGVTGNTTLTNTQVNGTLGVTGTSTLAGVGATSISDSGTLGVTGATTLSSVGVTGATTVGGTLGVTGNATLGAYTQIGASGNTLSINPNISSSGNTYISAGGTGAQWWTPPIGGLWFTPNYTYTSTSLTNPMLYFDGTATGSAPANSQLFTKFGCNDSVDYVTNGGAQAAGNCLWVIDNLSAGWTGQRLGLQAMVNVLAPSTATGFVSAAAFNASSAYNMGGTGAQPAGYLTAYQYDAEAYSGATYLVMLEGWEGATIVHPGASVAYVNGGKITVSGCTIPTASCNGLTIVGTGAQSASARIGLSFGSAETPTFGVAPTGTLIGSQAYVGGNTLSAAYGVDFSGVTFSTGAFKSTGFLVDPTGVVTGASYKAGATAGVTCSGTPTSSFAATGGIVTHC